MSSSDLLLYEELWSSFDQPNRRWTHCFSTSFTSAVDTIAGTLGGQISPTLAARAYNDWFNDFYHHRHNTLQRHYAELGISLS